MTRPERCIQPGLPLHLVQRGHNRAATFGDDDDRWRFLEVVREASVQAQVAIHSYVLMSNHVHLLATPADAAGPRKLFEQIGRRYVRTFNWRYGRSGSLWDGRYHSSPVDCTPYFLACSRYIELNPVRAAMTLHPSQHRWSSYQRNAEGAPDELVTPHPVYVALGETDAARQAEYRTLFAEHVDAPTVDHLRRATRTRSVLKRASPDAGRKETEQRHRDAGRVDASPIPSWTSAGWGTSATF